MKLARLAGITLASALATGLVAASVANAEPLFNPRTGTLTALTGVATLTTTGGADTIECKKSISPGTITGASLAVLVIHFLECEGKEGGLTACKVHSEGAPAENLILTKTLHAVLGLVLPNIAAVLLLPIAGKEFVTLVPETGKTCIEETAVSGNIAGEIAPIGNKQTTGKVTFGSGVNQHFTGSCGGLTIAKLTAFSQTAIETTTATLDYGQETEIT